MLFEHRPLGESSKGRPRLLWIGGRGRLSVTVIVMVQLICTERDLCYKVLAAGLPANTPISAVMTRDPQAVPPDKALGHVLHLMFEGGFRHMPVVDESGVPLGLVSSRDALGLEIFRFAEEVAQREHLAEIL